jgi:RNA polymerase sigma-70 factor (ECF subfamily)
MDADQFTCLLRRHAGLLHKVAYAYCRNAADREDVVQEMAIQVWRSLQRYDGRAKETTWIYRIAVNVAISFFRREGRHPERRLPIDEHAVTLAVPPTEPSDEVRLLLSCIDELGPLEKALVLLYLDGHDHASIADVLGLSVSNVGTKLLRIKQRLRAAIEKRTRPHLTEGSHGTR